MLIHPTIVSQQIIPILKAYYKDGLSLQFKTLLRPETYSQGILEYPIASYPKRDLIRLNQFVGKPGNIFVGNAGGLALNFSSALANKQHNEIFYALSYINGTVVSLFELWNEVWPVFSPQDLLSCSGSYKVLTSLNPHVTQCICYDFDSCFSRQHVSQYFTTPDGSIFNTPKIECDKRLTDKAKQTISDVCTDETTVLAIVTYNPDVHYIYDCIKYEIDKHGFAKAKLAECLKRILICAYPYQVKNNPKEIYHGKNQQITWVLAWLKQREVQVIEHCGFVDDDGENLKYFSDYVDLQGIVKQMSSHRVNLLMQPDGKWLN